MLLDDYGLQLIETKERGAFTTVVDTLTDELGPQFGPTMDWWCGIGQRPYPLAYWRVIAAADPLGQAQAVIGLYREVGAPETEYWVGWFGVAPAFRRKGLGGRLIAYVSEQAKEAGGTVLKLYTEADNAGAIAFYESLGFLVTGTMADHPHDQAGSDGSEIIMGKKL